MPLLDAPYLPAYNTKLFCDIWEGAESFLTDMKASPIYNSELSDENYEFVFYLLFQRYGNNPIATNNDQQFKMKIATCIYAYAPTFFKKSAIQKELRALDLDELRDGYKSIQNRALNDATAPSTDTDEEIAYLNEQIVNKGKRSKADAFAYLWGLLRNDLIDDFLDKFKKFFSKVVDSQRTIIYTNLEEDD